MPVNRKALRKPKRIRASAFIAFGEPAMNSPMVEISLLQSKATVYDAIAAVVEKVRELTRMHTKGQSTGMHGYSVEDFFITVASDDEKHQFDPNLPLDPTRLLKEQVPSPCVLVLCVHPRLLAERKARSQNATAELRQVDLQHQLQKQLLEKRELKVQFIAQQRQEREEQQWQDSLAKDAMFRQHLSEERASEVSPAVRQQQQRRRKSQLRNGHIVEVLCSREVRAMYEADLHSQLMKRKEEEWLRIKAYEEAARSSVARSPKRGPARGTPLCQWTPARRGLVRTPVRQPRGPTPWKVLPGAPLSTSECCRNPLLGEQCPRRRPCTRRPARPHRGTPRGSPHAPP
eukprot:RCo001036